MRVQAKPEVFRGFPVASVEQAKKSEHAQSAEKPAPSLPSPLRASQAADRVRVSNSGSPHILADVLQTTDLGARIDRVRDGRVALAPEERSAVASTLGDLSKAQLKALRELLVERPPHPRLAEMRGHAALKGPPSVDGILSILAGEPLGLRPVKARSATLVGVPAAFSQVFASGKSVSVKRSSGATESDWKIRGQTPDGKMVVESAGGAVKLLTPRDLLESNAALLPVGLPVQVPRSQGSIDGGWQVGAHVEGGIRVEKPGAHKVLTLDQLIEANPGLLSPPKAQGLGGRVFLAGRPVQVTRSSGQVESGWRIQGLLSDSRVGVEKDGQHKLVPGSQLLAQNPDLIPSGTPVRVPRTGGWTEDGWMAIGYTGGDKVQVFGPQGERKGVPVADIIAANPELLVASTDVPTGQVVKKVAGPGLEQAKSFLQYHRIPANQVIFDGFVDGGRGMRLDGSDVVAGREVLVVDRSRDSKLVQHLEYARTLQKLPEGDRAKALVAYVDQLFRPTHGSAEDAANRIDSQRAGREVLIGDAAEVGGGGACRHRALMFKVLGDEAGLNVALVRGNMRVSAGQSGGHAWNELVLANGQRHMVDVMNPTRKGNEYVLPKLDAKALGPDQYLDMSGQALYGTG